MPRGIFGENPIKCWGCNSSVAELHGVECPSYVRELQAKAVWWRPLAQDAQGHYSNERAYNPSSQPILPTDAKERKRIPLYSGLVKYFPDALIAVAALSQVGSDQHHPGQPLHWERGKSTDHEDTLLRHLMESGTVDTDGVRHSTKVAWRALAKLQLELEAAKG